MLSIVLTRLLWRDKLSANIRVHPEERICIEIANMLRKESLEGNLKAVWSHCPNEGKRSRLTAMLLKAMGLIPGTSDYFFVGAKENGSGLIEIKSPSGKMSDRQKDFLHWCVMLDVRHAVCRSAAEVRETLIAWDLLTVG